ncbi:MAG TPA: hypothetical protein VFO73_05470 [Candidatus Limnocylindrales bacterium]|jgi:hypothetical protein|nr:hypothetical protein [Candidatus Limnocylindrales bacterium]
MTETGDALRATSDELLRDLEVLSALEDEKRTIEPGDPRLVELAERIESIASRILGSSTKQRELTEQIHDQSTARSAASAGAAIDDTPRPIADILAAWREAERTLAAAEPGSVDAAEAGLQVESLRAEYRRAHDARRSGR